METLIQMLFDLSPLVHLGEFFYAVNITVSLFQSITTQQYFNVQSIDWHKSASLNPADGSVVKGLGMVSSYKLLLTNIQFFFNLEVLNAIFGCL